MFRMAYKGVSLCKPLEVNSHAKNARNVYDYQGAGSLKRKSGLTPESQMRFNLNYFRFASYKP